MTDERRLDPLQEGELIPPGEVGPDLLGVGHIVSQLVELIRAVEPGSAIGLFGSAGIGKTTIGEQLKDREDLTGRTQRATGEGNGAGAARSARSSAAQRDLRRQGPPRRTAARALPDVELGPAGEREDADRLAATPRPLKFVYIDASESGGAGFRRSLVLACATELSSNVGRVKRQLRGASSHSRFRLPDWSFMAVIALILAIVALMVGLGLGIAKLVALATGEDFASIANQFVLAMLFAPAVAAAAFGLLAKSVTTDWSLPAPSNDDEFVAIFKNLFKDGGDDGLLVFVDEIDRAPPDRIADTLDGLRTFFGKGQCVFVVAADRQTLEHALSSWLGESTPEHAANPHYGAANAYLDKLFKYQLIVPPARTNALYQYARRATESLPGVWELLKKNDALSRGVIDVLIPPHITSPRQVNALLNGFTVTCHLLDRREPRMFNVDRVAEVAKLVCLRSEFPLFAADLHIDPRLPQFVLEAASASMRRPKESRSSATPVRGRQPSTADLGAERWERARAYVEGLLPVSSVPLDGGPTGDGADAAVDRELRRQQSRQLVAYLDRTQHVKGPSPDIIHAQAFRSELSAHLGERLSEAALAHDTRALDDTVSDIREEAREDPTGSVQKSERDALDMLSLRARARQASETVNALHSLLHVVLDCKDALDAATAALVLSRITSAREEAQAELTAEDHEALQLLECIASSELDAEPATRT